MLFPYTPNKDVLFDLEEFEGGRVLMENNMHCDVKGIGKIRIVRPDGTVVVLTDVRYMPTMSRNLISYGILERSGCQYEGKYIMIRFYKDGKEIISEKFNKALYYLQGTVSK